MQDLASSNQYKLLSFPHLVPAKTVFLLFFKLFKLPRTSGPLYLLLPLYGVFVPECQVAGSFLSCHLLREAFPDHPTYICPPLHRPFLSILFTYFTSLSLWNNLIYLLVFLDFIQVIFKCELHEVTAANPWWAHRLVPGKSSADSRWMHKRSLQPKEPSLIQDMTILSSYPFLYVVLEFLSLHFTDLCVSSLFWSLCIFIGGLLRALWSGQKNIREFTYLCQVCFQANINSFNPSNNDMRTVALLPPHLTTLSQNRLRHWRWSHLPKETSLLGAEPGLCPRSLGLSPHLWALGQCPPGWRGGSILIPGRWAWVTFYLLESLSLIFGLLSRAQESIYSTQHKARVKCVWLGLWQIAMRHCRMIEGFL